MRNVSARTPDQASYLAALGLFILMLVPHFLLVFKARADTLSALKRRTPTLFSQTLPPEFKGGPELVLGLVPNESATPFSAQTNHNLDSGNCTIEESTTSSSTIFNYSCSVFANKDTNARLEMRTVEGGAVDFYATIQSYPLSHRLFAIGLALSVYEQDSDELALPIFGGHLIKNPASTILAHKAIQPGPGMSMQFFSYTSGKGGFLLQGTNPRGENLYTSTHTAGRQESRPYYTGTFFEYVPDDKTRKARSWLFPYRLSAVEGDWFDAAKRYRSWVVENSLRAGIGILSNGRLEEQTKPLIDMLVIETLQPPTPAHLARIKRLKNVYGDDVNVWYFLWNLAQTKPQGLPYGHFGTYFPKLEFSPVLKELRSLGINVAPYTFPGAGSLDNPGILSHLTSNPPLESQTITNSDGSAAQILEAGQFPVVLLDFTPELVEYYKILAQVFFDIGFGGVYTDLPGIMWYDHTRDPGQESGVSSSYYENYRKMHASMREVFKKNGHHLVSGAEASFERLIPVVDMTLGMMLPKVFPGEKRTYPINLVEAVYKDFVQTLFADPSWGGYAYINGSLGPLGPDNHTMSWLLTEGAVKGRVLNSTQPLLYSFDYLMEEVTPGLVPDAVVYTHYTKMMKLLLKMQRRWKKFLKFGEALREPAVSGDQHLLDINTIDETGSAKSRESLQLYSISNAAFLHPQEGIGVFLANGGIEKASVVIDLRRSLGEHQIPLALKDAETGRVYPLDNGVGNFSLEPVSFAALFPYDECPEDPAKYRPEICGCGVSDDDTDGDGTPDCKDDCASDPKKRLPGTCGCGESDTDTDGDQTPDCKDRCARDAEKTTPGVCGCGILDIDENSNGLIDCEEGEVLRDKLEEIKAMIGRSGVNGKTRTQMKQLFSILKDSNAASNPKKVRRLVKKSRKLLRLSHQTDVKKGLLRNTNRLINCF